MEQKPVQGTRLEVRLIEDDTICLGTLLGYVDLHTDPDWESKTATFDPDSPAGHILMVAYIVRPFSFCQKYARIKA